MITTIPIGDAPSAIAFDGFVSYGFESRFKIYVTNQGDNTVSVINGTNYKNITTIPVGDAPSALYGPSAIAVDDIGSKIYVTNQGDNGVYIIHEETNKVLSGVLFNIQPPNSGTIKCKNLNIPMPINQHGYVFSGDKCEVTPSKGYEFQSWQKVDSLDNLSEYDKETKIKEIQKDIEDIYASRKINELHYDLLQKNFKV